MHAGYTSFSDQLLSLRRYDCLLLDYLTPLTVVWQLWFQVHENDTSKESGFLANLHTPVCTFRVHNTAIKSNGGSDHQEDGGGGCHRGSRMATEVLRCLFLSFFFFFSSVFSSISSSSFFTSFFFIFSSSFIMTRLYAAYRTLKSSYFFFLRGPHAVQRTSLQRTLLFQKRVFLCVNFSMNRNRRPNSPQPFAPAPAPWPPRKPRAAETEHERTAPSRTISTWRRIGRRRHCVRRHKPRQTLGRVLVTFRVVAPCPGVLLAPSFTHFRQSVTALHRPASSFWPDL